MIYLRHHGFPSPLLDWTKSPYIAAFFAYYNIDKNVQGVSIYAFIEDVGQGKTASGNKAWISCPWSYVKTHRRHFLQQSDYTICLRLQDDNIYCYSNHEEVFSGNKEDQDKLWKFILPASERSNILKKLDSMNINAFSLFGSEESLMDTVALREIEFKERFKQRG